jgi:vacuolar-type H+-ATPase subunit H
MANSYFAVAGKDAFSTKDTGPTVTWKCTLCKTGCLQMTMNRNMTTNSSKYQSYGKITIASPCTTNCISHTNSSTLKTIWLPRSNSPEDMALTPNQIAEKKQRNDQWVREARMIAQELLKDQEIHKKSWKFEYLTEKEIREQVESRNAKISLCSKNRKKSINDNYTRTNTSSSTPPTSTILTNQEQSEIQKRKTQNENPDRQPSGPQKRKRAEHI